MAHSSGVRRTGCGVWQCHEPPGVAPQASDECRRQMYCVGAGDGVGESLVQGNTSLPGTLLRHSRRARRRTPADLGAPFERVEPAISGAGPAVISSLAVRDDISRRQPIRIPVGGLSLHRSLRAFWQGRRQPPAGAARALIGYISTQRMSQPRN